MINISALEPKMSLVTNSLKYNDRFKKKKKSCNNAQNDIASIMLNLSTLRPYEMVLGIFLCKTCTQL